MASTLASAISAASGSVPGALASGVWAGGSQVETRSIASVYEPRAVMAPLRARTITSAGAGGSRIGVLHVPHIVGPRRPRHDERMILVGRSVDPERRHSVVATRPDPGGVAAVGTHRAAKAAVLVGLH